MKLMEGDVFRLSERRQAYVLGDFESIWLAEGAPTTVVRVLGDQAAPSGYELEVFVRERCRHALLTVHTHEISESLRGP